MTDFLNRVLSLIIAFILLVIAPLAIYFMYEYEQAKFLIIKDISFFIDNVTLKGSVEKHDINELEVNVNSHGIPVKVTVSRLMRVVTTDVNSNQRYTYFKIDDLSGLNVGDIIQVKVKEIGYSVHRAFISRFLFINLNDFEVTLAGVVR